MIDEYLTKKQKDEATNMFSVLSSLEGEAIESVIWVNEAMTLIVMKSGCSILFNCDGSFKAFNQIKTKEIVETYIKENIYLKTSLDKVTSLSILQEPKKEQNQDTKPEAKQEK